MGGFLLKTSFCQETHSNKLNCSVQDYIALDRNISIHYSYSVPDYIAPRDVYATARSMGPNPYVNLNYNLTWFITVDNGFWYLLRLHFCEIQSEVYKQNQRVFKVYVNNMIADQALDVIFNAKGNVQAPTYTGVPVYKDYILSVLGPSDKQSDLLIELHPDQEGSAEYADAILNGLEVFKVNESSGNLAGPNPDLTPPLAPEIESLHLRGKHGGAHSHEIIGAAGGLAAMLAIGACLYFILLLKQRRKRKEKERQDNGVLCKKRSNYGQPKKNTSVESATTVGCMIKGEQFADCVPVTYCRRFKFSEIAAATNNFDETLLLGVGGFSKVYMGVIENDVKVAIKRGKELSQHGLQQFHNIPVDL